MRELPPHSSTIVACQLGARRGARGEIVRSLARVERLRERFAIVAATSLVDGLRATLQ